MSKERSRKPRLSLICKVGKKGRGRSMATSVFMELSRKHPELTLEQIFDKLPENNKQTSKL